MSKYPVEKPISVELKKGGVKATIKDISKNTITLNNNQVSGSGWLINPASTEGIKPIVVLDVPSSGVTINGEKGEDNLDVKVQVSASESTIESQLTGVNPVEIIKAQTQTNDVIVNYYIPFDEDISYNQNPFTQKDQSISLSPLPNTMKYCIITEDKDQDKTKCIENNGVAQDNIKYSSDGIVASGYDCVEIFSYVASITIDLSVLDVAYYKYTYLGNEVSKLIIKNANSFGCESDDYQFAFGSPNNIVLIANGITKCEVETPQDVIYIRVFFSQPLQTGMSFDVKLNSYYTFLDDDSEYTDNTYLGVRFSGDGLVASMIPIKQDRFKFEDKLLRIYDEELDRILICPTTDNCIEQFFALNLDDGVELAKTQSEDEFSRTTLIDESTDIYQPRNSSRQNVPAYLYLRLPDSIDTITIPINKPIVKNIIPILPKREGAATLLAESTTLKYTGVTTLEINVNSITLSSKSNSVTINKLNMLQNDIQNTIEVGDRLYIIDNLDQQSSIQDLKLDLTNNEAIIVFNKVSNNMPEINVDGNNKVIEVYTGESSEADVKNHLKINGGSVTYIEGLPEISEYESTTTENSESQSTTPENPESKSTTAEIPESKSTTAEIPESKSTTPENPDSRPTNTDNLDSIPTTTEKEKDNHLSGGIIAGIVCGCVVFVAIVAVIVVMIIKKKKNTKEEFSSERIEAVYHV